ncbi:MAG: hypothetical protein ACOCVV_11865 [Marinobacter sp.]
MVSARGRREMPGFRLDCVKCDQGSPPDECP